MAGLTGGRDCPGLEEVASLKRAWQELGQRAEELETQRGEDMQRSGEYQECVAAVEELFHQVSREWDYLARYGRTMCVLHPTVIHPYVMQQYTCIHTTLCLRRIH